ncbi:non-ribosomal peptide synthetase condensation domain protein [Streptomyces tateyamensis]|uniref:Non-ribosomal peptide synthetase condensation domain protein n=1 Tax=Streptomyces tateyamensis TaxID=565073 RepID=A0A2V4N6U7_9ACTN|nr:condensation domain-containing protein [Streptomyces tateyamensis]PYC77195.1 non-ribosomal peptide synthetase condensation domain protein [Streptomyces tateyamensis]
MTTPTALDLLFTAGRSGSGPATWGQQAIWSTLAALDPADTPRYNVAAAAPLEPGLPRAVVLAALQQLLHLHDALHTRLVAGPDGGLRQVADPAGSVPVQVVTADGADQVRAVEELHRELAGQPFDTARQWPIRVGLVEAGGLVRQMSLVLAHTAVDGTAFGTVVADLAALAGGADRAELERRRSGTRQPLAEAEEQAGERARRRDRAAREQFLRKLRLGPPRQFPAAPAAGAPFPNAVLSSPALGVAVDAVAARHRVSSSSVLLAATAATTARLAGRSEAVLLVVVNNRFLPGLAEAVSTVSNQVLLHLPAATGEFGELVRRTQGAALAAYRHGYYDRRQLVRQIDQLAATGVPLADRSCVFNDTRDLLPAELAAEAAAPVLPDRGRTVLEWPGEFAPRPGLSYALDVLPGTEALRLAMTANPAVLPRPAMERFLYGIEELVVTEARRP